MVSSQSDARSGDLTLGFDAGDFEFSPHGMSEDTLPGSDAWLDNGPTYANLTPQIQLNQGSATKSK